MSRTVPPSSLRTQGQQQEFPQQHPQQPQCQDQEVHHPAQQLSKSKHQHNTSEHCRQHFSFFFPQSVLQATLNDRWGSNDCTFYLAKSYHANIGHLPAPTQTSPMSAAAVMSCIIQGNATHDTLTGGGAINFAVDEAVCQLRQSLGQIKKKRFI